MANRRSATESNDEITQQPIKKNKLEYIVISGQGFNLDQEIIILWDNRLFSLPADIGQLHALKELRIGYNEITSLPPEIGKCTTLEILQLNDNHLCSIPPEIGNLRALKELLLHANKLESLPPEIGDLSVLEKLNLGDNYLRTLPEEFWKLGALKLLYLYSNFLTSLSPKIGNLSALNRLYLHDNEFTSLPPEIGKLGSLKWLHVNQNHLTSLPVEIGAMRALEVLDLGENSLTHFLPNIQFMDKADIIEYFRNLYREEMSWSKQTHFLYPLPTKKAIFTLLIIASTQNGNPRHPEALFYKLPKELLYIIFHFISFHTTLKKEILYPTLSSFKSF